jgi:integrase/recombinase XerC
MAHYVDRSLRITRAGDTLQPTRADSPECLSASVRRAGGGAAPIASESTGGRVGEGRAKLSSLSAVESGVDAFVHHLNQHEPMSRRTRQAYISDLRQLCRFLHTRIAGPCIGTVEHNVLADFLDHLHTTGIRPRTIARKLTSIRALFAFFHATGLSDGAPVRGLRPPRSAQPVMGLSAGQVRALLRLPSRTSFSGNRDLALMELLYGCGLRLEELLALRVADVDVTGAELKIEGGRRRVVPLGRQTTKVMTRYLASRAQKLSQLNIQRVEAGVLFVSNRGGRLRPRTAQNVIERYVRRLEGSDPVTSPGERSRRGATALRSAFAQHLLDAGADAAGVGILMGKSRAPTPASMNLEDVQRRYDQAHPRSRLADAEDGVDD